MENVHGSFVEKDNKKTHFFFNGQPRWMTEEYAKRNGVTHTLETREGVRPLKVLKTVAYVAIDENEDGELVFEKWSIQNVRYYT